MRDDFTGIERDLYIAIENLYSSGWMPSEDIKMQSNVIKILEEKDFLKDHSDFFYKKTKIVSWDNTEATPLERLIFAAAGFENCIIPKPFSENIRPEPLQFLLKNLRLDPAKLLDIETTLGTAIDRLNGNPTRFTAFKAQHGMVGANVLKDVTKRLEDLYLNVMESKRKAANSVVAAVVVDPASSVEIAGAASASSYAEDAVAVAASPVRASSPAPIVTRFKLDETTAKAVIKAEPQNASDERSRKISSPTKK